MVGEGRGMRSEEGLRWWGRGEGWEVREGRGGGEGGGERGEGWDMREG